MRQQEQILSDPTFTLNVFDSLIRSFTRSLTAQSQAPKTVATYLESLRQFKDSVVPSGMAASPDLIRREHNRIHHRFWLSRRHLKKIITTRTIKGAESPK